MSTIVTRSGKGSPLTHVEVDANFTNLNTDKYQEGSAIGAVTPAAGTFTTLTATGQTKLGGASGSNTVQVDTTTNTGQYTLLTRDNTNNIQLIGVGGSANLGFYSNGGGNLRFYTSSGIVEQQFQISRTASAVNYVQVTGAATGGAPTISAQGSDANVDLTLRSKGAYSVFVGNTTYGNGLQVYAAGSANYLRTTGTATTVAPSLSAQGSDTNISQVFQSKGTGAIDLAAGSSGVNISNGGTVTAITRTATGGSYTTTPSVAISAPTTAGGVQATGTAVIQTTSATIAGGGTGYTVGDILTMVGGTLQTGSAGTFRVASVSGGVITAVDTPNFAQYSTPPTNPVSVTGGTGSGATLTVTYIFGYVNITNAGSGYVEQPTVSFSGGGGSGAAAYASVGSGTTVKSVGSTMSFYTPSGETVRLLDGASTGRNYLTLKGGTSSNGGVFIGTDGSDTNVNAVFFTKGTGTQYFATNGGSTNQLVVAHTASAVNYVQVTGAATGARPTISSQGSDSTVGLSFATKGGTPIAFNTNTNNLQFVVNPVTNPVNYMDVRGAVSGGSPEFRALGSDTNIDLTLTPKGTGNVRFGTYTASVLAPTGYIEIKDSGGTTRRLLVG